MSLSMRLYPRIIPCLLVHEKGLVKTTNFKDPKYVGDPINAVKIFNEKHVDELAVFDIDASIQNREPDYKMIENLAYECRMPLCYGGGIHTAEQAKRIFELGVEKIAISTIALQNPEIVKDIADRVGQQSVVVVLDVKKKLFGEYEIYTCNGRKKTNLNPFSFTEKLCKLGIGEIIINSIDRDGKMTGYDFELYDRLKTVTTVPMTLLGGAGNLDDIGKAIEKYGIIGVGAGSLFVFKGKYKAVLINYPTASEKEALIKQYYKAPQA